MQVRDAGQSLRREWLPGGTFLPSRSEAGRVPSPGTWAHSDATPATTDEVARNHVSFLKELAPLPGRDLSVAYRLNF
jgi:hypothetical protein